MSKKKKSKKVINLEVLKKIKKYKNITIDGLSENIIVNY